MRFRTFQLRQSLPAGATDKRLLVLWPDYSFYEAFVDVPARSEAHRALLIEEDINHFYFS